MENSDVDAPTATYFGVENPWSGNGPRIGLNLTGKREEGNMGFNLAFAVEHANGTFVPDIDDNAANLWLKPFGGTFETLTFTLGKFNVDKLRFKYAGSAFGFHNYVMYVRTDLTDEDATFRRWQSSGFGTHLSYEPMEGLYIGAAIGSVGMSRAFAGEFQEDGFVNALKNAQVGVGYTIPDIGFARLQWIGFQETVWGEKTAASSKTEWVENGHWITVQDASGSDVQAWVEGEWKTTNIPAKYDWNSTIDKPLNGTGTTGKIQGAFNLKAIKDIDVDIGFSIPLVDKRGTWADLEQTKKLTSVTTQAEYVVSAGFDVNAARPFRLLGVISLKFGGYKETAK
jgi:hypothetical protein